MLSQGANAYNTGLTSAAAGGHESIVRLMLDQGATNYNEAMNSAAYCGQIHIVRLMLEKGAMISMGNESSSFEWSSKHS